MIQSQKIQKKTQELGQQTNNMKSKKWFSYFRRVIIGYGRVMIDEISKLAFRAEIKICW